jgi:hypothetical protein
LFSFALSFIYRCRAVKTEQDRIAARWPRSRIALQTALDVFRCFAKQDRLADVRTDCRAPAEDPGESSRSQGTTTKSGRDVCGGVKWAAPEIT